MKKKKEIMHDYKDILPMRLALLKCSGPPVPKRDKWKAILETYHLTKETCFWWRR